MTVTQLIAADTLENIDVWVVMPMFNEGSVVGDVVRRVRETFPHVVCVDDGSTDGSAAAAAAAGAAVVRHPINLGQGAALQTGISFALTDPSVRYLVTFDSDGQHRVDDALRMVRLLRDSDHDLILGSRFLDGAAQPPAGKRALLRAARAFNALTTGLKLTDAHNGLRAFTVKFAASIEITMPDMAHASEFNYLIKSGGFSYDEVPVHIDYTDYSKAKGQSAFNAINIAFDILLRGRS